jgi:hypothetical protein
MSITKTQGLKNFLTMALRHAERGNAKEAWYILNDISDDIGCAYKINNDEMFLHRLGDAASKADAGDSQAVVTLLTSLIEDVGYYYSCDETPISQTNFFPEYDAKRDGDYSQWLVSHNID